MIVDTLLEHIKLPIENMEYILWGIEIDSRPKGKGIVLRVYIDHEDGVSIDDCQAVSKQISVILDVEDIISSEYVLEVSSPGSDRRVFNIEQAHMLIGFDMKIKLHSAINGRKNIKARLNSIEENNLTFLLENKDSVHIEFSNIDKMRVIPQW